MYPYLKSWTAVAKAKSKDGELPGLKVTGQINVILLGKTTIANAQHKQQAEATFRGLMSEYEEKLNEGRVKGPLYRLCNLNAQEQQSFVKDHTYISPCFEAFSLERLQSGGNFAINNTRFMIIDEWVPAVSLVDFNPQQKEVLIRPGMLWAVTAKRTSPSDNTITEIGLTYIGNTVGDASRSEFIARKAGLF